MFQNNLERSRALAAFSELERSVVGTTVTWRYTDTQTGMRLLAQRIGCGRIRVMTEGMQQASRLSQHVTIGTHREYDYPSSGNWRLLTEDARYADEYTALEALYSRRDLDESIQRLMGALHFEGDTINNGWIGEAA